MKKSLIVLAVIFLFNTFLFCQNAENKNEPSTIVEFETEAGCFTGRIIENVWNVKRTNNGNQITLSPTTRLSMLDWQFLNAIYTGYKLNLEISKKIVFSFDLFSTYSGKYGIMEDYDWKFVSEPDHLTNYSNHINIIEDFYQIEFMAGHSFRFGNKEKYVLTPKLGVQIQNISFAGYGGFKLYEDHNWEVEAFENKTVIAYSQFFISPELLIENRFKLFSFMTINFDLGATWIKTMEARDQHCERNLFFIDKIENAWLLQAKLAIFFKLGKNHKLGIKGGVQFIPESYGLSYSSTTSFEEMDNIPNFNNLGGTTRILGNYAIVYQLNF